MTSAMRACAPCCARRAHRRGEMIGLGPRANLPDVLRGFVSARQGRITYGELSRGWTSAGYEAQPRRTWRSPPKPYDNDLTE
jgi:hypothetical protein